MNEKVTLAKQGSGLLVDRKSEFYGYAAPVENELQAQDFIASVKKKHSDARHNVFAYVINNGVQKRYSDDGEPQGSAGRPVLDVIEKNGLDGVVIVVTRYFGGILLGTGGLVRAYSGAASAAVEDAGIVTLRQCTVLSISASYNDYAKISNVISKSGANIENTEYDAGVTVTISILTEKTEEISATVTELTGGRAAIKEIGTKLAAV